MIKLETNTTIYFYIYLLNISINNLFITEATRKSIYHERYDSESNNQTYSNEGWDKQRFRTIVVYPIFLMCSIRRPFESHAKPQLPSNFNSTIFM